MSHSDSDQTKEMRRRGGVNVSHFLAAKKLINNVHQLQQLTPSHSKAMRNMNSNLNLNLFLFCLSWLFVLKTMKN